VLATIDVYLLKKYVKIGPGTSVARPNPAGVADPPSAPTPLQA
jgi:hypothetical protein